MQNLKIFLYALIISSFLPIIASAQDAFAALQFLVGDWEAEPSPAVTVAKTNFALDLQGKAIVRHNHVEYPPAAGKPAYWSLSALGEVLLDAVLEVPRVVGLAD